jgi:hypothetical protein
MKSFLYCWLIVVTVSCVLCTGGTTVHAQDDGDPFASDLHIGDGQDRDEFASEEVSGPAKTSARKKERVSRKESVEKHEEKVGEKKEGSLDGSADEGEVKVEKNRPSRKAETSTSSQPLKSGMADESDF